MKKGIIVIATAALAAAAGAQMWTNVDPNNAWVGATNTNPTLIDPWDLRDGGHQLSDTELNKVKTYDTQWYTWEEPTLKNYDWMLFSFTNSHPDAAICNWQIGIDDADNDVHMLYWYSPNETWIEFDSNNGGINPPPPTRHPDVTDEINQDPYAQLFIMLAVGYTPDYGDWITCNICDLDVYNE